MSLHRIKSILMITEARVSKLENTPAEEHQERKIETRDISIRGPIQYQRIENTYYWSPKVEE